jgi:hypothetical protein
MRTSLTTLILLAVISAGTPAEAQTAGDLRRGLEQGGGWVSIPIEDGVGLVRTAAMPTLGLVFTGCVRVWPGHSGTWELRAHDAGSGRRLQATVTPGEPLPFSHTSAMMSQLDLEVRWSEPRDTTLVLWVGLETPERHGDAACSPPASSGG